MLQFSQFSLFPVWRAPAGFQVTNQGKIHETTTPNPSLRRVGNDAFFFCTQISSAAGAAGELCTTQRKEPDMAKRENEGKKEKKQKKERKIKRKQYRGLLLNPISVPRTRTCAREDEDASAP